ncbi:hypothetical protein [Paenibacillus sp. IITD108]|uniref:hypothetical protein n=1 Tax=Paenibacillus sp. IITD108 TaxID=3116649 RepID=UPI002F41CA3B
MSEKVVVEKVWYTLLRNSFWKPLSNPRKLSMHYGQLLISNEKGETESKNGNGEAAASAFVG